MKEIEYIKATDLAKLRIAIAALSDMMPCQYKEIGHQEYMEVCDKLYNWRDALYKSKELELT